MYTNSEKIASGLTTALLSLDGDEDTDGAVSRLQTAVDSISDMVRYLPESDALVERLRSISYDLEDCAGEIRALFQKAEYDPRELEEIEERLDLLYRLGMKYGSTEEEMLPYLGNCRKELQTMEFSDEILQKNWSRSELKPKRRCRSLPCVCLNGEKKQAENLLPK